MAKRKYRQVRLVDRWKMEDDFPLYITTPDGERKVLRDRKKKKKKKKGGK